MPPTKRANQKGEPTASRPHIVAPEYGIPKDTKGLLPWSYVTGHMQKAKVYWISTVSPDSRPHATPVDGLWIDDRLYFGGSPQVRWHRNVAANPAVCIHLASETDVVILHGDAHEQRPDGTLARRLVDTSTQKYGYAPEVEVYESGGVYVFHPRVVFAWTQFPKDATRWRFQNGN